MEKTAIADQFIYQTSKHVFLTGKAGTGKTTYLRALKEKCHKNMVVAAPTGIAAINAAGATIHSLFQLPFGGFVPEEHVDGAYNYQLHSRSHLRHHFKFSKEKQQLLRSLELLVIDEVSMLRSDLLDAIDFLLRFVRRDKRSFGGVQLLLIGDLQQLPPVVGNNEWNVLKNYYRSPYFFDAKVLQEEAPVLIELDKIYRQSDDEFIELLNNIRNNKISEKDVDLLNQYYRPGYESKGNDGTVLLTTHNDKADKTNGQRLKSLKGKSYKYRAKIEGKFNESSYPIDTSLELKEGAQVMFVKNDLSGDSAFFNGKMAVVEALSPSKIKVVTMDDHREIEVPLYEWENIKYKMNSNTGEVEQDVVGKFIHFPLKLAWAITVHKSQGLTFDKAILDLESAFASGQVYVAMSRLRSLRGLILTTKVNEHSLKAQSSVESFINNNSKENEVLVKYAEESKAAYLEGTIAYCFDVSTLLEQLKEHVISYNSKKKGKKVAYVDWAMERYKTAEPLQKVSMGFRQELRKIFANEMGVEHLLQRVRAGKEYFLKTLQDVQMNFLTHINQLSLEKGTKGYIAELKGLEQALQNQCLSLNKAEGLVLSALEERLLTKGEIAVHEVGPRSVKIEAQTPKERTTKTDTKLQSLQLYLDNYSIGKIAKERGLTVQTIEGHLAYFIEQGDLNALDFVSQETLDIVGGYVKQNGIGPLSKMKSEIKEDLSYTELKYAIADFKHQNAVK